MWMTCACAHDELVTAKLDCADDPKERVALLGAGLDSATTYCKSVGVLFKAGLVGVADVLQAKVVWLGLQAKLVQEQSAAGLPVSDAKPPWLSDPSSEPVVTDQWLVDLTEALELRGPRVTDAVLQHRKGLSKLRSLALRETKITDAGLASLKGLTNLEELSVAECAGITDAGLENLRGLTGLRDLSLKGTKITDDGIRTLRKALPNCDVNNY